MTHDTYDETWDDAYDNVYDDAYNYGYDDAYDGAYDDEYDDAYDDAYDDVYDDEYDDVYYDDDDDDAKCDEMSNVNVNLWLQAETFRAYNRPPDGHFYHARCLFGEILMIFLFKQSKIKPLEPKLAFSPIFNKHFELNR